MNLIQLHYKKNYKIYISKYYHLILISNSNVISKIEKINYRRVLYKIKKNYE